MELQHLIMVGFSPQIVIINMIKYFFYGLIVIKNILCPQGHVQFSFASLTWKFFTGEHHHGDVQTHFIHSISSRSGLLVFTAVEYHTAVKNAPAQWKTVFFISAGLSFNIAGVDNKKALTQRPIDIFSNNMTV